MDNPSNVDGYICEMSCCRKRWVNVGCGAGFAGDRIEAAVEVGRWTQYLAIESLIPIEGMYPNNSSSPIFALMLTVCISSYLNGFSAGNTCTSALYSTGMSGREELSRVLRITGSWRQGI